MKKEFSSKSKEDYFDKIYKIYKEENDKLKEVKMIEGATEAEVKKLEEHINSLYVKMKKEFWVPVESYAVNALNSNQSEIRNESYSKLKENGEEDEEAKKQRLRNKYYEEILNKLQNEFKGKLMNELTERFIDYICFKCTMYEFPTEGTQIKNHIMMNLKRYIYLALAPRTFLTMCDNMALDTLCMILSDIIFQILFESHKLKRKKSSDINSNQKQICNREEGGDQKENCSKENEHFILITECLKELAIRGAEKKLRKKFGKCKRSRSTVTDYENDATTIGKKIKINKRKQFCNDKINEEN